MDRGWIKAYRKTIESSVFQNEGLFKVWMWCLLKASHQSEWFPIKTGRGETVVNVQPGQFIFGRKKAAKELKMKPTTVQDRIKKLEKLENLVTQPGTHYSIITIRNWRTYQDTDKNDDTQSVNQPSTNRHIQECKEVYKGEFFSVDEKLHTRFLDAYPSIDLIAEYKKMTAWLVANPSKRKTKRGYPRFINNWLSKTNSKGQETWWDRLEEL